jgi:hypothetical protein
MRHRLPIGVTAVDALERVGAVSRRPPARRLPVQGRRMRRPAQAAA